MNEKHARIVRERDAFNALIDAHLASIEPRPSHTLTDEEAAAEIAQDDPFQRHESVGSDMLDRLAFDPERGELVVDIDVDLSDLDAHQPPSSRLATVVRRCNSCAVCNWRGAP